MRNGSPWQNRDSPNLKWGRDQNNFNISLLVTHSIVVDSTANQDGGFMAEIIQSLV